MLIYFSFTRSCQLIYPSKACSYFYVEIYFQKFLTFMSFFFFFYFWYINELYLKTKCNIWCHLLRSSWSLDYPIFCTWFCPKPRSHTRNTKLIVSFSFILTNFAITFSPKSPNYRMNSPQPYIFIPLFDAAATPLLYGILKLSGLMVLDSLEQPIPQFAATLQSMKRC